MPSQVGKHQVRFFTQKDGRTHILLSKEATQFLVATIGLVPKGYFYMSVDGNGRICLSRERYGEAEESTSKPQG